MKIEEINIDGFGKFHKYHCQTSGKLEVFYGKNESGKTTLRKFMIAMLFGLRNQEDSLQDMMISPDISQ